MISKPTSRHRVRRELKSNAPLEIALLAAESPERDISLHSSAAVAAALADAGHRVTSIDPAGRNLAEMSWIAFDVCFIALHGGAGEDGRIQQHLDDLGVPYTGSRPDASRLAMCKHSAKQRFFDLGVPTPAWMLVDRLESDAAVAARVQALGYPLVIKPNNGGSSLGLSIVDSAAQLSQALAQARHYAESVIAESFVHGREFTVAIIDDRTLPLLEIITPERAFTNDAKYRSAATEFVFEFDLADDIRDAVLQAAQGACRALGTSGLARVDIVLALDGLPWVLEVNTVPGMTDRSLAPLAAARAGLDMPALCQLLVRQALAQSPAGDM